jgi:hypothetical protein
MTGTMIAPPWWSVGEVRAIRIFLFGGAALLYGSLIWQLLQAILRLF